MPTHFSLTRSGKEISSLLFEIEKCVLRRGVAAKIDFKKTEMIHVEACILLFSEVERFISCASISKPITIIDPVRRRPREVLKQIGLHNLTGDSSDVVPERPDVVFWKATRGFDQSGSALGPMVKYVAATVNQTATQKVVQSGIWKGVSEAVTNSVDHAYKFPRKDGFVRLQGSRWTMFTQIKDGLLTIAVCDSGCGYSESVPKTIPEHIIGSLSALFTSKLSADSQAILLAMEYGRTSTGQAERGKGSRDALRVLTEHKRGEMFIYSNCGSVRYKFNEASASPEYSAVSLDFYVSGTIIGWILPIEGN